MSLLMYISELRLITQAMDGTNTNPVDYLILFFQGASIVTHSVFVFVVWTKSDAFLRVLQVCVRFKGAGMFMDDSCYNRWIIKVTSLLSVISFAVDLIQIVRNGHTS
jgi:hypothetical protein